MNLQENNSKHYYGFVKLPNNWVDDNDRYYSDEFFEDKEYEDLYFDDFFDMDQMFGHENSLFGTKGLPVGHPNRTSKSFDQYNEKYGPMVVRVVKDKNLKEHIRRVLKEEIDKTKIIELLLDKTNLLGNKRICGFQVISPEKNTEKFYYLKKNIPYKIKVYYVGGPASEYWPRTQSEFDKQMNISREITDYVKGFLGISVGVDIINVSSCKEYEWIIKP